MTETKVQYDTEYIVETGSYTDEEGSIPMEIKSELIRCKDCIYYHKAHIEKDGKEYDYSDMPKEAFGLLGVGVTSNYGINISGMCELEKNCGYDEDKSVFRSKTDFCSHGRKAK